MVWWLDDDPKFCRFAFTACAPVPSAVPRCVHHWSLHPRRVQRHIRFGGVAYDWAMSRCSLYDWYLRPRARPHHGQFLWPPTASPVPGPQGSTLSAFGFSDYEWVRVRGRHLDLEGVMHSLYTEARLYVRDTPFFTGRTREPRQWRPGASFHKAPYLRSCPGLVPEETG